MASLVTAWFGFPQANPTPLEELKQNVLLSLISCLEINSINCNNGKRRVVKDKYFMARSSSLFHIYVIMTGYDAYIYGSSLTSLSAVMLWKHYRLRIRAGCSDSWIHLCHPLHHHLLTTTTKLNKSEKDSLLQLFLKCHFCCLCTTRPYRNALVSVSSAVVGILSTVHRTEYLWVINTVNE